MHPFGGTPICPRCSKAVYLAEQVLGPGRKLYHKPCLSCTICKKRLDSYTLLEHSEQPYCKSCHLKNFGTRDLRHANLPLALPPAESPPRPKSTSPPDAYSPTKASFTPAPLVRPSNTGSGTWSQNSNSNTSTTYSASSSAVPRLRPNRSLATSPISPTFSKGTNPLSPSYTGTFASRSSSTAPGSGNASSIEEEREEEEGQNVFEEEIAPNGHDMDESRDSLPEPTSSYASNTGRPGIGTIPRTVPLNLNGNGSAARTPYKHYTSHSVGSVPVDFTGSPMSRKDGMNSEGSSTAGNGGTPLSRSGTFSSSPSSFAPIAPLMQTATGTRYGVALTGGMPSPMGSSIGVHMTGSGGSPRKWGAGTPSCARCGKSVYFAEQTKAVGKIFHKNCLRCVQCNASLDSNRLRDHDGDPYCVRCHQKYHGPQGNGYALLGKAGG